MYARTAKTTSPVEEERNKTPEVQKLPETFKSEEHYQEKPTFKPVSHSPKISPSSIPNPSPSVSTKQESFPNYGFNNLYSIPGYSAFQAYQGLHPQPTRVETPKKSPEFVPFPLKQKSDDASPPKKAKTFDTDKEEYDSGDGCIKTDELDLSQPVNYSEFKTESQRLKNKSLERKTPDNSVVKSDSRLDPKYHKQNDHKPCPAQLKPMHIKTEVSSLKPENITQFRSSFKQDEFTKFDNQYPKTECQSMRTDSSRLNFKSETNQQLNIDLTKDLTETTTNLIKRESPFSTESSDKKAVSPSFKSDPLRQYFKNDSISQQQHPVKLESRISKPENLRPFKPYTNHHDTLSISNTKYAGHDRENFKTEPFIQQRETQTPTESKMSITSLSQGSGATVTIPTLQDKKNPSERFSLITSIPISSIDMKCVGNPPDSFQSNQNKKPPDKQFHNLNKKPPENTPSHKPFQPLFQSKDMAKVEIQSNIVIKTALQEPEKVADTAKRYSPSVSSNSISTLINAAEAISNSDSQQWKNKTDLQAKEANEPKNLSPSPNVPRPPFSPLNTELKISTTNPAEGMQMNNEPKNQILFIQNKNATNQKMFLTISQPQNPQVLLQRNNFESKNLQAPSRLSSLSKKTKEEVAQKSTSKVVALKRLHQENCDENDFENLITENQIYGNKIVVKEKSQGTSLEQDLKKTNNMKINEVLHHKDTNNVVIQPVYFSNVHFQPNLMMINNTKGQQFTEQLKLTNKIRTGEGKMPEWNKIICNETNTSKQNNVSKEIHVLKTNNSVLQTLAKQNKQDLLIQSNQKVIMNPQILYQVPMLVETDSQKLNTSFINQDYTKFLNQNKKDFRSDQPKSSDKLYIACPYQMDSKLQPKIVITNIRPKLSKIDEISALDTYEKRRRIRRQIYLSNKEKDKESKSECKKFDKVDVSRNIITPDKMKDEICKEFAKTKDLVDDELSDSDSEYDETELKEYEDIIEKYVVKSKDVGQKEFLSHFNLGTHDFCKDRIMEKEERSLQLDSVALALISIGRIESLPGGRLLSNPAHDRKIVEHPDLTIETKENDGNGKVAFMSNLRLGRASLQYREDYEKAWKEILNERRRRDGTLFKEPYSKQFKPEKMTIDTSDQLQILTEIKKYVNINNNLIKKRLDPDDTFAENANIHTLAEKNFSELSKLSKMADRSVKLFSGNSKRDLNPGFDSENIETSEELKQPVQSIVIPNFSKIISLKTAIEPSIVSSTQAISMDEPKNSAAGLRDDSVYDFTSPSLEESKEYEEMVLPWPGLDTVMKSYMLFDAARKKELQDLRARNTQMRIQRAHANQTAAREAETARALLAERQALTREEIDTRQAIDRLIDAVNFIRRYQ